jgi:hypothetical protein
MTTNAIGCGTRAHSLFPLRHAAEVATHPEHAAILDEARTPRPRAAAISTKPSSRRASGPSPAGDTERALEQLRRLVAVHRARQSLAAAPAPDPAARPRRQSVYNARPTIAANMAVRAHRTGETVTLEWDPVPGVSSWAARLSERVGRPLELRRARDA